MVVPQVNLKIKKKLKVKTNTLVASYCRFDSNTEYEFSEICKRYYYKLQRIWLKAKMCIIFLFILVHFNHQNKAHFCRQNIQH